MLISHIGILMHLLPAEPRITARLLVLSRYIYIWNDLVEPLFDGVILAGFKSKATNKQQFLLAQAVRSLFVNYPIKNYSGVSVEFRQIKAAIGAPKQQMLPSFCSDNSTAITGDFKHPIVCDFPAGLASEFSRESPKKIKVVV